MPSNISSSDGLWTSASNLKDLSVRKARKSRGAPMKERLNNFSDNDDSGVSQISQSSSSRDSPSQDRPISKDDIAKSGTLQSQKSQDSLNSGTSGDQAGQSPVPLPPSSLPKKTIFTRLKKVSSVNQSNSALDVFHFEGEGLQFRGKLIGMKDVDAARGDEMCQLALMELTKSLKQSKEHKTRIGVSVSLSGLKIKDEKGTIVMHQHTIPKISYIWRDQTDPRAFGYVYGTPDTGHRFFAVKAEKSADALVGAIHSLFQVAFRMKQHEIDVAKKGQDDTSSNGSADSKKENGGGSPDQLGSRHHHSTKVDEANLLDLESELSELSKGIEHMKTMPQAIGWTADFGESPSSSPGTSLTSDPWGDSANVFGSVNSNAPDIFQPSMSLPMSSPFASQTQPPLVPARPPSAAISVNQYIRNVPNVPFPGSAFNTVSQSLPPAYVNPMLENPFMVPTTPFPSPANNSPFNAGSVFDTTDNFVSVFDRPIPQPVSSNETKLSSSVNLASNNVFSTELFEDLAPKLGGPRGRITRDAFPETRFVRPTLGDLRGEQVTLIPSPTTVDPFLLNGPPSSSMGSPSSSSSHVFAMNGMSEGPFGPGPQIPLRKVSSGVAPSTVFHSPLTTSSSMGSFQVAAPPGLPPRRPSSGPSPFAVIAPPPAPRRSSNAPLVVSALGLSMQQQQQQNPDPFADNFFTAQ